MAREMRQGLQVKISEALTRLRALHDDLDEAAKTREDSLGQTRLKEAAEKKQGSILGDRLLEIRAALQQHEVQKVVRGDRMERLQLDLQTVEAQIAAFRAMLERERSRRRAVEKRFEH